MTEIPKTYLLAGGIVLAALAFASFYKPRDDSQEEGDHGGFFQDMGEDAAGAVIDLADGVISGAAKGIGDIIGVPRTSKTACQIAMESGNTWDASKYCSAGTFLGYINPFK
jgi:hypothetical protein